MKKSIFSLAVLFSILGTVTVNAQRASVYNNDDVYVETREVHIDDLKHRSVGRHDRVVEVSHRPAAYHEMRHGERTRAEVFRPVSHSTVVVTEPMPRRTVVVTEPVPVPVPAPVVVPRSSSAATGMVVGAVLGTVIGAMIH